MKTIKIIDLLVRIANGEDLPIIKHDGKYGKYDKKDKCYRFYNDKGCTSYFGSWFNRGLSSVGLNDEVEIIKGKPKKIEEISIQENRTVKYKDKFLETLLNHFYDLDLGTRTKINELVERVNYLLEKSDEDE